MAPGRDQVSDAYQLEENPFAGRFQAILEPQTEADLSSLYATVDGLRRALERIEGWATAWVASSKKPRVALVRGPKGSGRSSTARYVAYRAAMELDRGLPRGKEASDLLASYWISTEIVDEHYIAPVKALAATFATHVMGLGVVSDDLLKVFFDITRDAGFRDLTYYRGLHILLRNKAINTIRLPIFCIEDVRNIRQILSAVETFCPEAIIVCTTTLESVERDFAVEASKGVLDALQMNLDVLRPDDVADLINQRWKLFARNGLARVPIAQGAIDLGFANCIAIRGVILVLDDLLSHAARRWEKDGFDKPPPEITAVDVQASIIRVLLARGREIVA